MRIETAAKVDSITVANNCKCDDKVKPLVEMVILVDGSDSYNDISNLFLPLYSYLKNNNFQLAWTVQHLKKLYN